MPPRWDAPSGTGFERREGFPDGLMTVQSGIAVLENTEFSNGAIEFDMKALAFADTGIQFRRKDRDSSEFVYLRADPDCPAANDCIQYAPITHGLMQWDIYSRYQGSAPISEKGWNHCALGGRCIGFPFKLSEGRTGDVCTTGSLRAGSSDLTCHSIVVITNPAVANAFAVVTPPFWSHAPPTASAAPVAEGPWDVPQKLPFADNAITGEGLKGSTPITAARAPRLSTPQ